MDLTSWTNTELSKVAKRLQKSVAGGFDSHFEDGLDLAGRHDIYNVLDDLLAVLFPSCFGKESISNQELGFFMDSMLRTISHTLNRHILATYKFRCKKENCPDCNCEDRTAQSTIGLIEALPQIREMLIEDVQAAFDGDPAATSLDEIILSYPGMEAIAIYRIAHKLSELGVPMIPRIMSERAHSRTGIDIHPGAKIGRRFFIDHGTGVVIGETSRIGDNVKIYQGVTLGALSPFDKDGKPLTGKKRHPDIEDDVIIYANATILGGETVIGKGAVIGGNAWIISSVEPGKHVYKK